MVRATVAVAAILSLQHGHPSAAGENAAFREEFAAAGSPASWQSMTGDGAAQIELATSNGIARMTVDARNDRRNIWWALLRHPVTPPIDPAVLARDDRELRVEARVRTDTAPRRINLHVNHTRTTDFHSHLREYDLAEPGTWYVVSMTTDGFAAQAGDGVFVQLAMMDWGRGKYLLEIDYIEVSVVDPATVGPDRGRPLPYRPSPRPPGDFRKPAPLDAAVSVDREWPAVGGRWRAAGSHPAAERLPVGPTQITVLHWNLEGHERRSVSGWGVLELTGAGFVASAAGLESFAELRVVEVLGRPPDGWPAMTTLDALLGGRPMHAVFNEQPMLDVSPASEPGAVTRMPVSPPVLERLLSGRTHGLAILSQGGIAGAFHGAGPDAPALYFNVSPAPMQGTGKEIPDEE